MSTPDVDGAAGLSVRGARQVPGAAQAYDKLQDQGRQMRFKVNEGTGKLVVEVHDLHGQLLFQVPASKALDVASGGSLD